MFKVIQDNDGWSTPSPRKQKKANSPVKDLNRNSRPATPYPAASQVTKAAAPVILKSNDEPFYQYVVNIPVAFRENDPKGTRAQIDTAYKMCETWKSSCRHIHVVIGVNTKTNLVPLQSVATFTAAVKLPQTTIIPYQWCEVRGNPQAINYIDIRNGLFYHPDNQQIVQKMIANGNTYSGQSVVKMIFLDPDTTLTKWQLDRAETVWNSSRDFHLISSAYHFFDAGRTKEAAFIANGKTLGWEELFADIGSMYDCRAKQIIGSQDVVKYTPVPANLDPQTQLEEIAKSNFKLFELLQIDEKHTLFPLKSAYKLLLDAINLQRVNLKPTKLEKIAQPLFLKQIIGSIQEYEKKHDAQLQKLHAELPDIGGESVLYPSENALILSLFDKTRKINFFAEIQKRQKGLRYGDLWGLSTCETGKGEGEQLVRNVGFMQRTYLSHVRVKLIDFSALGAIRTLMPPRFVHISVELRQHLPGSIKALIAAYTFGRDSNNTTLMGGSGLSRKNLNLPCSKKCFLKIALFMSKSELRLVVI